MFIKLYTAVYILFLDFILMSNLSHDFHILHTYHLESNLLKFLEEEEGHLVGKLGD